MVDILGGESVRTLPDDVSPTSLTPVRTIAPSADSGSETKKQLTADEAIQAFMARKHRIRIFKESRILFDPKQLPGVTPEESLDFLIKGLKMEDSEANEIRKLLDPHSRMGRNVRDDFNGFIEYMNQQNKYRTVSEIWEAADADPFTKIALQWEIQNPANQYADSKYIKEHASSVAADLRKLDALLKKLSGAEIFLQCKDPHNYIDFTALTTADERGIGFTQQDPNNPYRVVVLGSQTALREDRTYEHIKTEPHLTVPFELRKVLCSRTPEDWGKDQYTFWREGKYRFPFDPDNPFPGIITGEELTEERKGDAGLDGYYNELKEAIEKSSSANGIVPKP